MNTPSRLVFENTAKTARITQYPEYHCFEIALTGTIDPEDYKTAFTTYLDVLVENHCCRTVFNNHDLVSDTLASRAWFLANYLPQAKNQLQAEHYRVAVVMPTNRFQRMTVELVAKGAKVVGTNADITLHDSTEAALEWMGSLVDSPSHN